MPRAISRSVYKFPVPSTPIVIAAIPLAIWLYLFLGRGNFWWLREDKVEPLPLGGWPSVVAIVPARNEAENMGRAVSALVNQDYAGALSVVVVDDQSEDGTASLARLAAQEANPTRRVTVLSAPALQPGWTGKLRALDEGVRAVAGEAPDFFWFTDADVVHAPAMLRRLVFRAQTNSLDLASLLVLLPTRTLPEQLLIPPFLFFFLMLYPPQWTSDQNCATAGAAGGCILLRREALERIGGLAAIRGEVIDDCALARAVKRSGGKIWMSLTRSSASLTRYNSLAAICDMIARTAFTQLGYSLSRLLMSLLGLFATFLLVWIVIFTANGISFLLADVAVSVMMVTFIPTVRLFRLSPLWALTLPISAVFYGYATCVSAIRYWLGRGGQWKGRVQAPRAPMP